MRILFITYNCGKRPIDESIEQLFQDVDSEVHDLVVVGLQEVAPIINGCFADLDPYLSPIEHGLRSKLPFSSHTQAARYSHGSVALLIYSRRTITPSNVMFASTGCGYLNSSLKGAVGVHMTLDGSQKYTFVSAHLAANEGMVSQRNQDFMTIATSLDFGNGHGLYQPDSHLFVLGDLNYRCVSDPLTGIRANEASDEFEGASEALLTDYHSVDELSLERSKGNTFYGFDEAPISFAPTYKFLVGSSSYDRRRIPSWCDRVLYLTYEGSEETHVYKSVVECCSSDHKPVLLDITVPVAAPVSNEDASSLNLDPSRLSVKRIGSIADRAIGWSLWFGTTRRGNFALCVGVILLIACYALM